MLGTMLALRQTGCDLRCLLCLFALEIPFNHLFVGRTLLPADSIKLCQQELTGFWIDLSETDRHRAQPLCPIEVEKVILCSLSVISSVYVELLSSGWMPA